MISDVLQSAHNVQTHVFAAQKQSSVANRVFVSSTKTKEEVDDRRVRTE